MKNIEKGSGSVNVAAPDRQLLCDRKLLGLFLKKIRNSSGHSVRALAEKACVNPSTVQRLEAGLYSPRVDVLQRILSAIGYSLSIRKNGDDEK